MISDNNLDVQKVFINLKAYIEKNKYKGWDPYDGLNSKIFKRIPFSDYEISRIIWTQFVKRFPINKNFNDFSDIYLKFNSIVFEIILCCPSTKCTKECSFIFFFVFALKVTPTIV